jgi:hypothetical protein
MNAIGGGGEEGPSEVELSAWAEEDAVGVKEVEVGVGGEATVDAGRIGACDAGEDGLDVGLKLWKRLLPERLPSSMAKLS